jgi:hypothetical protein
MTNNTKASKPTNRLLKLLVIGIPVYFLLLAFSVGAGFAANGGQANVFSPHSSTEIQGENTGAIISIVGDKNRASISMLPNQPQEQDSARGGVGIFVIYFILVGIVVYLSRKLRRSEYV